MLNLFVIKGTPRNLIGRTPLGIKKLFLNLLGPIRRGLVQDNNPASKTKYQRPSPGKIGYHLYL